MKPEDHITAACVDCVECRAAGVEGEPHHRDPYSGQLLHGFALRRWLDARATFQVQARAAVGAKGRHARGFEKLVKP